jgi:hypothetical protein
MKTSWTCSTRSLPRASSSTGDLELLVRPGPDNARRVLAALHKFGAPLAQHGIGERDFVQPGTVYQLGLPPRRIDLLTAISGVSFERAWATRTEAQLAGRQVSVLGRQALLENKRATGRAKDLADVRLLEQP